MRRVERRTPDVIRRGVSRAKVLVDKAGNAVTHGFWKVQTAVKSTGEAVKDAGQKIEDAGQKIEDGA